MKKLILFFGFSFFLLIPSIKAQQDTTYKQEISSWSIEDFFIDSTESIDSTWYTLHDFNPAFGNIYLSSFGSPIQHNIISERNDNSFIFKNYLQDYYYTKKSAQYYKTTTPITYINYNSGGGSDQISEVEAFHTQNVNEYLNFSFKAKIITSSRFYETNDEKTIRSNFINFSGSYTRGIYQAYLNLNSNTVNLVEVGGIQNKQEFESGVQDLFTENLQDAQSVIKSRSIHLSQKIRLNKDLLNLLKSSSNDTTQKESENLADSVSIATDSLSPANDSISNDTLTNDSIENYQAKSVVEGFALLHHFDLNFDRYKYIDNNPLSGFYSNYPIYIDSAQTIDTTSNSFFSNKLLLSFNTSNFYLHAGLHHELDGYSYLKENPPEGSLGKQKAVKKKTFNNFSLTFNLRTKIFENTLFKGKTGYYFTGYKQGDIYGKGEISQYFDSSHVSLNASFDYREPYYFHQNYNSNHFSWHNSFDKITNTSAEIEYSNKQYDFLINIHSNFVNNHVFMNESAVPEQYNNSLFFTTVSLKKSFHFWKIHNSNNLYYQYSSNPNILNIPNWYVKESIYLRHTFHFKMTGGNLHTQLGVSMYYYPEYYANAYMPALSLFYNQNQQEVGGKFIFNVFANLKVKRTTLFIKGFHINSPLQQRNYYSAPDYPMSPIMLKFGIFWSFYD